MDFKETIIRYHIQSVVEAFMLGAESKEELFSLVIQRFKENTFHKDTPPAIMQEALEFVEESSLWLIQNILMLHDEQFKQIAKIQDDIIEKCYSDILKSGVQKKQSES